MNKSDEEKVKELCDKNICRSMGEARRIVFSGKFEKMINKFEKVLDKQ
jgi:ABC-type polysaccharide/polyol phosphate transport system ATPase subunit